MKALGFELTRDESGFLALVDLENPKASPLSVDFTSGAILHRLRHGLSKGQPLPKALGLKSLNPDKAPYVIDATAGLGVDAFFVAALGCRVRAIERSPVVAELLADGYARLRASEIGELAPIAARLGFEQGSSALLLSSLSEDERPDVVYVDPMYPSEGHSSALPKKGMQFFRRLIGDDLDAGEIFEAAMKSARERVVVKRPLGAPHLGPKPTHVFEGKTARYDMYLAGLK